ncbi:hypothetical protein B0H19DRAFT_1231748 [Mycena capillaripes]|nr:hypothetical protein B0H19DRAFT_1231748 [Mycena capillaripes]
MSILTLITKQILSISYRPRNFPEVSMPILRQNAELFKELISGIATSPGSSTTKAPSSQEQSERHSVEFVASRTKSIYASLANSIPPTSETDHSSLAKARSHPASKEPHVGSDITPAPFELDPTALERWFHTGFYDDSGEGGSEVRKGDEHKTLAATKMGNPNIRRWALDVHAPIGVADMRHTGVGTFMTLFVLQSNYDVRVAASQFMQGLEIDDNVGKIANLRIQA